VFQATFSWTTARHICKREWFFPRLKQVFRLAVIEIREILAGSVGLAVANHRSKHGIVLNAGNMGSIALAKFAHVPCEFIVKALSALHLKKAGDGRKQAGLQRSPCILPAELSVVS